MSKWKQLKNNGYGVTVTFENERGERLSGHRPGRVKDALVELVDTALARDPTFRVIAISSPQQIITDLRGREPHPRSKDLILPEPIMLRQVKRAYACHPRLQGKSRQSANPRAYRDAEDARP